MYFKNKWAYNWAFVNGLAARPIYYRLISTILDYNSSIYHHIRKKEMVFFICPSLILFLLLLQHSYKRNGCIKRWKQAIQVRIGYRCARIYMTPNQRKDVPSAPNVGRMKLKTWIIYIYKKININITTRKESER